MVGFGIGAADEVVEPVSEPLDAPEGVLPNLTAVSFGKVREEGANAGVERNHAIAAWGLNGALRRVRNDQPVTAAFPNQSAFFLPRRNGLGHTQRSQDRVINAVLRNGIIRYVAGLLSWALHISSRVGE